MREGGKPLLKVVQKGAQNEWDTARFLRPKVRDRKGGYTDEFTRKQCQTSLCAIHFHRGTSTEAVAHFTTQCGTEKFVINRLARRKFAALNHCA